MAYYYGNELYHHGILGMKWGKKNGPPYPLGSSDHSASEKKAGWRKSLDGGSNIAVKRKKKKEEDNSSSKRQSSGETKVFREVDNNKANSRAERLKNDYYMGDPRNTKLTKKGEQYKKEFLEKDSQYRTSSGELKDLIEMEAHEMALLYERGRKPDYHDPNEEAKATKMVEEFELDRNKETKKRNVAYESGGNDKKKKSVSEMSDKELQQAINRARLENKYADFAGEAVRKKSNTKDALEKTRGIKKQVNNFLPAKDDKFKKEPVPDSKYPWDKSKSQEENKRLQTEYHENRKRIEQANKDGQAAFDAKKQNIKIGNNAVDLGLSTIESASKLSKAKNDRKVEKIKEKAKEQAQEMDYKDLEATVKRLDMERQYNELINSKTTSTGREKAMQALEVTGAVLAVAVPAYQLYKEIKKSSSNKGGGS